jgi:hypothetical protein
MANSGLHHQIKLIDSMRKFDNDNNQITATVTFEKQKLDSHSI